MSLYSRALNIAQTYDVSIPKDCLVVYSISFLPTKENRDKAFEHVKKYKKKMMMEHTDCGAKLSELGLENTEHGLTYEQVFSIWGAASKRMIAQASGDVTAFVDNADERSVFRCVELPNILANPGIKTINKIDKKKFAKQFAC